MIHTQLALNGLAPGHSIVLLAHAGATLAMVGVIWFVQIVHYPLFAYVGEPAFTGYAATHQRLTGYIVGPFMFIELASAVALVTVSRTGNQTWAWIGLAILVAIWLSTFLVQVPLHAKLAQAFDPHAVSALVMTNWFRTLAWTVRGALSLMMIASVMH